MNFNNILIIIPTYNRANLLPEALESAINQDYPHKKIVIIDDGSTDQTEAVCKEYISKYPEIDKYIRKPNGGCSSARNLGSDLMDESIGYVCFLDSDDKLLPGKLKREVELLDNNSLAGFTYSDSVIYVEETGQEECHKVAAAGKPERFAIEHFLSNEAKCSAILYKVDIIRDKRFRQDLRYNEDSEFLQRIAIEYQGVYSVEPGCWVRSHSESKSRNSFEINKAVFKASKDILIYYPEFYNLHKNLFDRRIDVLRRNIFVELARNKQWKEAAQFARTKKEKLVVALRLSAYYK